MNHTSKKLFVLYCIQLIRVSTKATDYAYRHDESWGVGWGGGAHPVLKAFIYYTQRYSYFHVPGNRYWMTAPPPIL